MNLSTLKNKINKLSQNPGVYVFYGGKKEILYVGKATNLRSRVSSYFRAEIADKKLGVSRPKRPKDTKFQYASRPIEMMIHEVADMKTIETESVLEALILESNLIKKYQPKYNAMGKDDKSFSYFVITKEEWPRVVIMRGTELDLVHNSQSTVHGLKNKKLRTVNRELRTKKTFGPYTSKKQMEIALKIVRKIFPFHSGKQKTEKGCLDFQIGTCPGPYAGAITRADYLKNIRGIRMILEGRKKNLVKKMEKEMREYSKRHEFEKAGEVRNKIFALQHIQDIALISEDKNPSLTLPFTKGENRIFPFLKGGRGGIFRIEAYDISNISGQYAVGSMVVFKNGEPDKAQYRKFKIKTVRGADDVGMLREVLLRRFNNDWPLPNLILLDGGIGHLNMGAEVLKKLELNIPLAAVAKGKNRKNLELRISNLEWELRIKNIVNDKILLKRIMDEAHRFAVGYHRKLRKKSFIG